MSQSQINQEDEQQKISNLVSVCRPPDWLEKEKARLSNILEYDLSDHDIDDKALQAITRLAAAICDKPLSFITLVGTKYVNFLSRDGCKLTGTDRQNSFCNVAIEQDGFFEIQDSLTDERFKENVFVNGQEKPLRFYAAYSVTSPQGFKFGSLCVCDWKPNKLNETQKFALKTLTDHVMLQLELRKQNKKLTEANEKAEKLSKAKDEFISNVSHELRTPLNAINGYAEILSKTSLDSEQQEAVIIIKDSSDILITLVNDILDFSKINSDKLKLEKIPFDLKKTVKLVYDLLLNKAEKKNVSLEMIFDDRIPKKVLGDKVRINQIIMNLAGNAIKFTQKGKVTIEVKLNKFENTNFEDSDYNIISNLEKKNQDKNSYNIRENLENEPQKISTVILDFSVKDTGIGIPPDKIDSIFERFEQAGAETTRKFGGTGLGLNISKNLVELQGGKLQVKSILGQGSEFYFTIAFEVAPEKNNFSDQTDMEKDLEKLNTEKFAQMAKLRVLVCEDNSVNIKLIKHLFKNKITYLEVAENGRIGIEILKSRPFDVILMDLHMPEMDGFEATKYIRNVLKSNIPIIGFTANCSEDEKELCLKIGMNDYITKSFANNEIFEKVASIISIFKNLVLEVENKNNKSYSNVVSHSIPNPSNKILLRKNIDQLIEYHLKNIPMYLGPLLAGLANSHRLNNIGCYNTSLRNDSLKNGCTLRVANRKSLSSVNLTNRLKKKLSFDSNISKEFSKNCLILKNNDKTRRCIYDGETSSEKIYLRSSYEELSIINEDTNENIRIKERSSSVSEYKINDYHNDISLKVRMFKGEHVLFSCPLKMETACNFEYLNIRQLSSSLSEIEDCNIFFNNSTTDNLEDFDHVELSALKELSNDDEEFEKEIIQFFVENFPKEIESLEAEVNSKNQKQIKFLVHKMKSPLGMFGLKKIKCKLEKIEKNCETNIDEALLEFQNLCNNLKIIYEEFNSILKEH
jgi:signal transduction histidine kinase/DNA-binding NarL/FixJ family response regulator/HPt (histidine-containing phosphotransfer) domain-containing protein